MLKGLEDDGSARARAGGDGALLSQAISRGTGSSPEYSTPICRRNPQHDVAKRQMGAGGTVVALDIAGGKGGGVPVSERLLRIVTISNNLGDAKSIVTHPATGGTTHQRLAQEQRRRARDRAGPRSAVMRPRGCRRSSRGTSHRRWRRCETASVMPQRTPRPEPFVEDEGPQGRSRRSQGPMAAAGPRRAGDGVADGRHRDEAEGLPGSKP